MLRRSFGRDAKAGKTAGKTNDASGPATEMRPLLSAITMAFATSCGQIESGLSLPRTAGTIVATALPSCVISRVSPFFYARQEAVEIRPAFKTRYACNISSLARFTW